MTVLSVLALVFVSTWLAALSVAVIFVVRQVTVIMASLERSILPVIDPELEGPEPGAVVPESVSALSSDFEDLESRFALLIVSSTCQSCAELVDGVIAMQAIRLPVWVIVGRDGDQSISERLPANSRLVKGTRANEIAGELGVESVPFAISVKADRVLAKAHPVRLRSPDDFRPFLNDDYIEQA